MLMTMSSSSQPSSRARADSATLMAVSWPPWGKPITVQTFTSLPLSISVRMGTSQGRAQTEAQSYFRASSQPRRMSSSVR